MKKKIIIITSIILTILAVAASSVYALWYISSTRLINPADVTSDVVRTYIANGISGTYIYGGDASLSGSPKGQFPSTGNLDSSKLTYYYNTDNSSTGTEVAYSNIATKGPIDANTYYFYVSYQKGDQTVYVYADNNNSLFSFDITPLEINLSSDDTIDLSYNTSNSTSNVVDTEFKNNYIYSTDRDNISLSASVTSTNSIYYASLSLNGTRSNNYTINTTSIPMVAYISTTYYSTIEYALESSVSGNTVYVIPNTNPSITRACEVKSGVTLTFPYNGTTYERTDSGDEYYSGFAINNKDTYCKNTITIKKVTDSSGNVVPTITINGTVNIGGQRRSTGPQGCTSGNYVEWLVESDVRIDIYGTLYCMGYIREDSDYNGSVINVYNTGTLTQPMVSYDWGSAGNAKGAIDEDIFPFNYFDCPQVSPSIYFYSGAKLEASVWMYGNSAGDMKANAYIIGDTSDIALVQAKNSDGSDYIYWKNTDTNYDTNKYNASDRNLDIALYNNKTSHKIELKLYGDYSLSYLKMEMSFKLFGIPIPVNVDSRNYFLPFSNFFDIKVMNDASFDVQYPVKFLPGANITIENGGTVNINNSVIIYETRTGDDGHTIYSYDVTTPAKLTNNGTLNINAAFGGKIYAGSGGDSTTKINVTTVGSVTSRDAYTYGSGTTSNPASVTSFTLSGQATLINEFTSFSMSNIGVANYSYTTYNGAYGFGTTSGSVVINGDDIMLPNATKTYTISDSSTHQLGDEFRWSVTSGSGDATLNSTFGLSVTVTGVSSGTVDLICDVYYKGTKVAETTKTITVDQEPYFKLSGVSVDTSSIYDNPNSPYSIGGIGDYRDITVTIDTNCTNYSLNWNYDATVLQLTSSSGTYPTFTYRFTTIGAGSDTLELDFTSDEITTDNIWTQDYSVADNVRVTSYTLSSKSLTMSGSGGSSKTGSITLSVNPTNANVSISVDKSSGSSLASISHAGNTNNGNGRITINFSGTIPRFASSYMWEYTITINNGVNGIAYTETISVTVKKS